MNGLNGENMSKSKEISNYYGTDFIKSDSKCIDFYYRCMKKNMDLIDVDEYATLNTLFGYDIGSDVVGKISCELWKKDVEVLDLMRNEESRKLVEDVSKEIGIKLDYSKWSTEHKEYVYY